MLKLISKIKMDSCHEKKKYKDDFFDKSVNT